MTNLYCTADLINAPSGGGIVTANELATLKTLGPCEVWGRGSHHLEFDPAEEPWTADRGAALSVSCLESEWANCPKAPTRFEFAHFYAGTFTETIRRLKEYGCRISYTAAAHDIVVSKLEHEKLGLPYAANYPHLTDPVLWERYLAGYKAADVLVCPSQHSADVMRGFGCTNRIEIIPHGCTLPEPDRIKPLPSTFVCGYLGAYGSDKGIIYLLQAWKKLNYPDAVLVLAGRDSISPWVKGLVEQYGGGNIVLRGWVEDVADFYNNISLYIQPSCTEGWGCEVTEAMAYGRPVLCSTGAGAADAVPEDWRFPACDVGALAEKIDWARQTSLPWSIDCRSIAAEHAWDRIKQRYIEVWKGLIR